MASDWDDSEGTPEIDRFSAGCLRKILRVSHRTLIRWDKNGYLPSQRTPRGNRYYTREQIEAFMHSTYVIKRKDGFLEYRPLEPAENYPVEDFEEGEEKDG